MDPDRSPGVSDAMSRGLLDWFSDRLERELVIGWSDVRPGEQVLYLSSGSDAYGLELARLGARVIGILPTAERVAAARERAADEGLPAEFRLGLPVALPFPDDSFDLVVMVRLLEFQPDPAAVVAEGIRLLRRYGRLVVGSAVQGSGWERQRAWTSGSSRTGRYLSVGEMARLWPDLYAQRAGTLYLRPEELQALPPDRWQKEESRLAGEGVRTPGFAVLRWDKPEELKDHVVEV